MGETSTNDVATQSLQASFADTSSNAVCTDLIQVLSLKAKSNDHYQIEPACRAVGQSSQPNRGFRVGARRCGRAAHRLARVKQPRKATKIRRFQGPLDVKLALERRFREPLDVKLALEQRFQRPLEVKLALERQFYDLFTVFLRFPAVSQSLRTL